MSDITVIGAGYVGLVTATCFAEFGNRVRLVEIDRDKVRSLSRGLMPVSEAQLPEMWQRNWEAGRLHVTGDYAEGLADSRFAFIAVGTPSAASGRPDLRYVRSAARSIAKSASGPIIVVIKSTVPVGTADMVAAVLARHGRAQGSFPVVSNPEFLREGIAIYDFMNPTRIVIGAADQEAIQAVADLYRMIDSPVITCDNRTAEMSKYASNVFLATRISFINEIARLCDACGVDIAKVAEVTGLEPRCGQGYLGAGLGWGGSCLPKDVRGLIHMARTHHVALPVVRAVQRINEGQPKLALEKLRRALGSLEGRTIGLLGLSFKPDSDDMREARSLLVISLLLEAGCRVRAYDPLAMETTARFFPQVTYCADAYQVAEGSDALMLVTEWDEFKRLDMARMASLMRQPVLIDGRNAYDPGEMAAAGFQYEGIGRRATERRRGEALGGGSEEDKPAALSGLAHGTGAS
jgi:UDPglucose 6-dehydrogenase